MLLGYVYIMNFQIGGEHENQSQVHSFDYSSSRDFGDGHFRYGFDANTWNRFGIIRGIRSGTASDG
jgi:hypothetical protein